MDKLQNTGNGQTPKYRNWTNYKTQEMDKFQNTGNRQIPKYMKWTMFRIQ